MNKSPSIEYFRDKGLLPFQADFAVTFLMNEEKPYWQLASPVGTGKTRVVGAIIVHELEGAVKKRFLFLSPAPLLNQWQSQISEMISSVRQDVKALIIDRKTYLELESRVPVGENPWPDMTIILMSIDLAKREDMAGNLVRVKWDLVIIDESHVLTGQKGNFLKRLIKSGAVIRVLLLTAFPSDKLEGIATKTFNLQDIVDWNGQPLYPSYKKTVMMIDFERSIGEKGILDDLGEFVRELARLKPYGKFQGWMLLRAASSSMYALEESLRRLLVSWRTMRNKIAHGIPWTKEDLEKGQKDLMLGLDEGEVSEDISGRLTIQSKKFMDLYKKLEALLDRTEEIQTDSKLDSLLTYLKSYYSGKRNAHLCTWTSFRNTAEYLMSSLEDLDIPVYVLTGSLNVDERSRRLDLFRIDGGILISTDAMFEGVALPFVDECINYDIPLNLPKLEQSWSRFLRIGRKSDFRMVFMRDKIKSLPWEEKLFETLKNSISSNNPE